MFFVSIWRIIKFSLQGFWRNIWLSLTTIVIIVLTLTSLTVLFTASGLIDSAVASIKNKVDIALYFKPEVTDEQALAIGQEIVKFPEVKEANYITANEAIDNFRDRHSNNPLVLQTLDELETNPLGPALTIKAHSADQYPEILRGIETLNISSLIEERDFSDHQAIISRLNTINFRVKQVGIFISIIFSIIALLVVFNTIRMGIYSQREEIGIMRLVGAGNFFIKAPFLAEGLIYAFLGTLIFIGLVYAMLALVGEAVNVFLKEINFNLVEFFSSNFLNIFGLEFLIILLLNIVSTSFAMRRYLKI